MNGAFDPAVYYVGILLYIACPSILGYWVLQYVRREWPNLLEPRSSH